MKRMLTALTAIAVLALAATAMAQYPGPNSIGIYTSTEGDASNSMSTSAPFEAFEAYVCITNPTSSGVSGWEAYISYADSPTLPVAPGITTTAGANLVAQDIPNVHKMFVGIGPTPLALEPNSYGVVHVATVTGYCGTTADVIEYFIDAYLQNPSLPSHDGPVYTDAIDVGIIIPLFTSTGAPGTIPVFRINGDAIADGEDASWGGVKSLFN